MPITPDKGLKLHAGAQSFLIRDDVMPAVMLEVLFGAIVGFQYRPPR
jgi:hypothetical protein